MTVSSTTTLVSYTGDGSTTAFSVTFPFYEITVVEITSAGAVTAKTEGTHYTVTGGEGSTGTVTMGTAPASGVTLRIHRSTARTQLTDYVENDPFPAETHEAALDRITMALQDIGQRVSYNSTIAASSGTITTSSAVSRYVLIGALVMFRLRITITDNGTGDGYVTATLPFAAEGAAGSITGTGRRSDGASLRFVNTSSTVVSIYLAADGAYPGDDALTLDISGWYVAS